MAFLRRSRLVPAALAVLVGLVWLLCLGNSLRSVNRPYPGFVYEPTLLVGSAIEPRWYAPTTPLRAFYKLVSVNGEPLTTPEQLDQLVAAVPVGTPLNYGYLAPSESAGVKFTTLETRRFTLQDYCLVVLPTFLLEGLVLLASGLFVFYLQPTSTQAQAYLALCGTIGGMVVFLWDYYTTRWFGPWYLASSLLIGPALLYFALNFPSTPRLVGKVPGLKHLPLALGALYASSVGLFTGRGSWLVNEDGIRYFLASQVVFSVVALAGILSLFGRLTYTLQSARASRQERAQARIILAGSLLGIVPVAIAFLVPTLTGQRESLNALSILLGCLSLVITPLSVFYAIVRFHLFDIELVIKRTATYTLAVAGVLVLHAASSVAFSRVFDHQGSDLVSIALVVLLFSPLRDGAQRLIDRVFFRTPYDPGQDFMAFARDIRRMGSVKSLLRLFDSTVTEALNPTHVTVLLADPRTRNLVLAHSSESEALPFDRAAEIARAVALHLAGSPRDLGSEPRDFGELRETRLMALRAKGQLEGVVLVGPRKSEQEYTPRDLMFLQGLGHHLMLGLSNLRLFEELTQQRRFEEETELAHTVLEGLKPRQLTDLSGAMIHAQAIPSSKLGGDFYDLIRLDDDRVGILVGDVSGKGVLASLTAASLQGVFRTLVLGTRSPSDVLASLNAYLRRYRPTRSSYATALYAVYDYRTHQLAVASAGHMPPISTEGTLPVKGPALGMQDAPAYMEACVQLRPDQTVLFYTDGLSEARNQRQELFGEGRIFDRLQRHKALSADLVGQRLLQSVQSFAEGALQDDLTVVVLKAAS